MRGNIYFDSTVSPNSREIYSHVHARYDRVPLLMTACFGHQYQMPRPSNSVPSALLPVEHKGTFCVPARRHG